MDSIHSQNANEAKASGNAMNSMNTGSNGISISANMVFLWLFHGFQNNSNRLNTISSRSNTALMS
jgi:hypothetical protein